MAILKKLAAKSATTVDLGANFIVLFEVTGPPGDVALSCAAPYRVEPSSFTATKTAGETRICIKGPAGLGLATVRVKGKLGLIRSFPKDVQ